MLAHIAETRHQLVMVCAAHVHEGVTVVAEPLGFAGARGGVFEIKKQTRIWVSAGEPTLLAQRWRVFDSFTKLAKYEARS